MPAEHESGIDPTLYEWERIIQSHPFMQRVETDTKEHFQNLATEEKVNFLDYIDELALNVTQATGEDWSDFIVPSALDQFVTDMMHRKLEDMGFEVRRDARADFRSKSGWQFRRKPPEDKE